MPKYRIIKSVAKNPDAPYLIREWRPEEATWETHCTSGHKNLKSALQWVKELQAEDAHRNIPAEVVWEGKDEPC